MTEAVLQTALPLPILRRGKVREVYIVDDAHLLLVASDRISAFDVVMGQAIPQKGAVLTQLSAWWFERLADLGPSHLVSARTDEILERIPALAAHRDEVAGRSMLVRRTEPMAFECVIRGYISGSAWKEYKASGTLAGEPMPRGLVESARLEQPIFSPATKAATGHDENVTFARVTNELGAATANALRDRSMAIYQRGRMLAAERGIIIADTKFEFGRDAAGELVLIDEVLTPDSSRFWPADDYAPGRGQASFDKQPLRDWLLERQGVGEWNGEAPGPVLPREVVLMTSRRYLDAYRRITGHELPEIV